MPRISSGYPVEPLRAGVRLVHPPVLATDEVEEFGRISRAVHGTVLAVHGHELTTFWTVHPPVNRFGKDQTPVAAQVDVGFFRRESTETPYQTGSDRRQRSYPVREVATPLDLGDAHLRGSP